MAERDGIWTRGGVPVEELPDPFAPDLRPAEATADDQLELDLEPRKRRRWPIYLYSITALIFVTLVWLVFTAPLSRALEPLADRGMKRRVVEPRRGAIVTRTVAARLSATTRK